MNIAGLPPPDLDVVSGWFRVALQKAPIPATGG
jgi:hypothetical protein